MTEPLETSIRVELGSTSSDGRTDVFVRRAGETLHCDRFNLVSERSRGAFMKGLATRLPGLDSEGLEGIERSLVQFAAQTAQRRAADQVPLDRDRDTLVQARDAAADKALESMPPAPIADAEQMLIDRDLIECIKRDVAAMGVAGEEELTLTLYVVATSRLLNDPLSAVVQGPSSSGKSHIIDQVGHLMPAEAVFNTTDLTTNALYYTQDDALLHKAVLAGERPHRSDDDQAEAKRALREMISSKVLRKTVPTKPDAAGAGRMVTMTIERHGPIAFIESTTQTEVFNEDANRVLPLATDESPEQTRRVLEHLALRAGGLLVDDPRVIERHHALQRLLRRVTVRIPYAHEVMRHVPDSRPEARRAAGHILSVVRAIALLHQRQRVSAGVSIEHGTVIDAHIDDYAIARRLLIGPLGRLLGRDLSPAIANFGRRVVKHWTGQQFTAAQAAEKDETIRDGEVARRYLKELSRTHTVELVEAGKGGKPNVYKVIGEVPEPGAAWLPTVEALKAAWLGHLSSHPQAPSGGGLVRQPAEAPEPASPAANTADVCQPEAPVPLGESGCQLDPSAADAAQPNRWRTSRTEAHQADQLPASDENCLFPAEHGNDDAVTTQHHAHPEDAADACCAAGWSRRRAGAAEPSAPAQGQSP